MIVKRIIGIVSCFFFNIALVAGLVLFASGPDNGNNGFKRIFPPQELNSKWELDLKYNSYYVSGATANHIFLGNVTAPQRVLQLNWNLSDTQSFILQVPEKKGKIPANLELVIDSPWVYLVGRDSKSIIHGTWKQPLHWLDTKEWPYFNIIVPKYPGAYVLQVYDDSLHQRVLRFVDSNGRAKASYVLEKYNEGTFSPDGMLHYDAVLRQFIYVYYYRNKFIFLDYNLKLLAQHHTIDTTFTPQLKIVDIPSEKILSLEGIAVKPNVNSSIDNGNLYIKSGIKSENESVSTHQSHTVIDIYSLKNGRYRFSFYVPKYRGKKLNDFKVRNHKFLAFYGSHLVIYQLRL